jgi:hypothetical protein
LLHDEQLPLIQNSPWDQALATAMHDLPVPADLQQRLLAEYQVAQLEANTAATPHSTRRRWLQVAVGGGLAALGFATTTALWPREPKVLTASEIQQSIYWLQTACLPNQWQSLDSAPANEFPLPRVLRYQPRAWQALSVAPGIVYELSHHQQATTAALFVLTQPRDQHPQRVAWEPNLSTQGLNLGYWQEGEQLYLLVTTGSTMQYRQWLSPQRELPVA